MLEWLRNFIAWDAATGKIVWSKPEKFSVWSGALTTAGGVVFYGSACSPASAGGAGIGMAAGLEEDNDGLGAVGGYKELRDYTDLGGQLMCSRCPTNNYKRATA